MDKTRILKKVMGKIVQVDADALTLETADGLSRTFRLDPNIEITDENFCYLEAAGLRNKQRAVVSYSAGEDGPPVAKMILSFICLQN